MKVMAFNARPDERAFFDHFSPVSYTHLLRREKVSAWELSDDFGTAYGLFLLVGGTVVPLSLIHISYSSHSPHRRHARI